MVLLPRLNVGLGSSHFARRYYGNHYLFSFPPATKMFQFAGFLPTKLCIHYKMIVNYDYQGPPFGYPRIFVYLPLPEAFRRLLRPSSAASAKAFTVRPY